MAMATATDDDSATSGLAARMAASLRISSSGGGGGIDDGDRKAVYTVLSESGELSDIQRWAQSAKLSLGPVMETLTSLVSIAYLALVHMDDAATDDAEVAIARDRVSALVAMSKRLPAESPLTGTLERHFIAPLRRMRDASKPASRKDYREAYTELCAILIVLRQDIDT